MAQPLGLVERMKIARLNHVSFAVRDFSRSAEFYEGILGLEKAERPDFGIAGAWYDLGAQQLHLLEVPDHASANDRLNPLANHVAFACDDYQETVAFFKDKGIAVFETDENMGQLWVLDPDGNVLEFIRA